MLILLATLTLTQVQAVHNRVDLEAPPSVTACLDAKNADRVIAGLESDKRSGKMLIERQLVDLTPADMIVIDDYIGQVEVAAKAYSRRCAFRRSY